MNAPGRPAGNRVAYKDLREWISALEAAGQLSRVKAEVDWKFEFAQVVRRTWDFYGDASPAMLFETSRATRRRGPTRSSPGASAPGTGRR